MKPILFITGILCFSLGLLAQTAPNTSSRYRLNHEPGDACVFLSVNKMNHTPFDPIVAGGGKMRFFLTKNLSMDTDLLFGKDYFHFGPGMIGLPTIFLSGDFSKGPALGMFGLIMMFASVEHLAYHIPLMGSADISPFVSLLRAKSFRVWDINTGMKMDDDHCSFATGIEINQYHKRFVISPNVEYNRAYDGDVYGFNFGISLGYIFRNKNY